MPRMRDHYVIEDRRGRPVGASYAGRVVLWRLETLCGLPLRVYAGDYDTIRAARAAAREAARLAKEVGHE